MKFGESLSEGLVQEWKEQYVDYRRGKDKIKKVSRLMGQVDAPNDTTPLLEPLEGQHVPDIGDSDNESRSRSRRRTSVFGFSTRSAAEELKDEKQDFLSWLEEEVRRVEAFYREKEKDVYYRFLVLEDQFHQLKEQKAANHQRQAIQKKKKEPLGFKLHRWNVYLDRMVEPLSRYDFPSLPSMKFMKPKEKPEKYDPNFRENQIRNNDVDSEDESLVSMESMGYSSLRESLDTRMERGRGEGAVERDPRRGSDYVRTKHNIPYFYAKKRLKEALVEHYRLIALIKSYRAMNRTALRKIVKKFDKATHSSTLQKFLAKIDEGLYFQTLQILDQISNRVEDLYLMFFSSENAEKKQGLERLKAVTYTLNNSDIKTKLFHESVFSLGLFLGAALPFFAMGLYQALHISPRAVLYFERRFLLQIWAGFFLVILAVYFVGLTFLVYTHQKINYKFIFEFNLATALDCRQMFLLPLVGFFLLLVCGWLSFLDFWPSHLPGRTWPLIYLAMMMIICLWPGKQFYARSREWVQIALWRIVCLGFYPVEFRDFYIGDILCSLTYSLSNLAFFLCLYADKWRHLLGGSSGLVRIPAASAACGSSHLHVMGFLLALPSIWRFLQCVRRFTDSGDAFPHLANMLKYLVGALYYCFMSLWRIHRTRLYRAVFITFASINSVLCALWDIIMDWSLGQSNLSHPWLRDNLFLGSPAYYYAAIVVDVVLRFQWIFYAFFSSQIQQSAVTSFFIAVAELLRRFVWMFFRMENEHCTNVFLFRASRENALPYPTSKRVESAISRLVDLKYHGESKEPTPEPEHMADVVAEVSRKKSTFQTISEALKKAHVRDFQRKKVNIEEDSDDDDDDEEPDRTGTRQTWPDDNTEQ